MKCGIYLVFLYIFKNLEGKNCSDIWCVYLYIVKINDFGEMKIKLKYL